MLLFCFLYLCICLCLVCIVICMHISFRTYIVYNSVICTKSFNIVLYNGHIVLNYTAYFVYSPLNSYVYIHWILDFKYILLLLYLLSTGRSIPPYYLSPVLLTYMFNQNISRYPHIFFSNYIYS